MEGMSAWPAVWAADLFLRERRAAAGAAAGLAIMIRMTTASLAAAISLAILADVRRLGVRRTARHLFAFAGGVALAFLPWLAHLAATGTVGDAAVALFGGNVRWYVEVAPLPNAAAWIRTLSVRIADGAGFLAAAALGLAALRAAPAPLRTFAAAWAFLDVLALLAPLRLYGHHFIQLVPSFSLLAATGIDRWIVRDLESKTGRRRAAAAAGAIAFLVALQLALGGVVAVRVLRNRAAGKTPERAAAWVRARTAPDDRILVWGYEPSVYLLSGRRAPGRYCHILRFLSHEDTGPLREFLAEMEAHPPAVILDTTRGPIWHNALFLPLEADPRLPPLPRAAWERNRAALRPAVDWILDRYEAVDRIGEWVVLLPKGAPGVAGGRSGH